MPAISATRSGNRNCFRNNSHNDVKRTALPYANLISDPVAAFICALLVRWRVFDIKLGRLQIEPLVIIFITTFISGGIFVTLTKVVLSLPMPLYLYAMLPAVLLVATLGSAVCGAVVVFSSSQGYSIMME